MAPRLEAKCKHEMVLAHLREVSKCAQDVVLVYFTVRRLFALAGNKYSRTRLCNHSNAVHGPDTSRYLAFVVVCTTCRKNMTFCQIYRKAVNVLVIYRLNKCLGVWQAPSEEQTRGTSDERFDEMSCDSARRHLGVAMELGAANQQTFFDFL